MSFFGLEIDDEYDDEIKDNITLVRWITGLAFKAAEVILDVYSSAEFGEVEKDGGSPLTRADTASHEAILYGLKALTPDVPVLSEESAAEEYSMRRGWERFWLVDPLDGTKEFLKKNGEFTVNIALIENGEPVLGVVQRPVEDMAYYAVKGEGAFRVEEGVGRRIRVAAYTGGPPRVVASRSHASGPLAAFLDRIGEAEIVNMGSSLKLCLVADGSADLYPRLGPTMEWDTAAAQCVVEAAGGTVTDLEGRRLEYNKQDLHNPEFMVAGSPPFPWRSFFE